MLCTLFMPSNCNYNITVGKEISVLESLDNELLKNCVISLISTNSDTSETPEGIH